MKELLYGIIYAAYVFGAFALIYVTNILFGITINCIMNAEKFDGRKLLNSVLKILISGFSMFVVSVTWNGLSCAVKHFGFDLGNLTADLLSIGTFVLLFIKGYVQLTADVYRKIRGIFEVNDASEFDTAKIENMSEKEARNEFGTYEEVGVG